jgi:hypothetical protein
MRTERISCIVSIAMLCIAALVIAPFAAYGADKLIVQDSSSNTQFDVTDTGTLILPTATGKLGVGTATPMYLADFSNGGVAQSQLHFSPTGADNGGYITSVGGNNFYLSSGASWSAGGWVAKEVTAVAAGSGALGYRVFLANTCTPGDVCTGLNTAKFVIDYSGNVTALSFNPTSTREAKDNIKDLSAQSANEALMKLDPVTFTYKQDPDRSHVGFIAEDVPALVASKDRKTLNTMDIVGVITKVLQDKSETIAKQQKVLDMMAAKLEKMEAEITKLKSKDYSAQK